MTVIVLTVLLPVALLPLLMVLERIEARLCPPESASQPLPSGAVTLGQPGGVALVAVPVQPAPGTVTAAREATRSATRSSTPAR